MSEKRFVCVWFDNEKIERKECLNTQDELRTIVDSFKYFNNLQNLIDYFINLHENYQIILIQSFIEQNFDLIHSFNQIHSIYIYNCSSSSIDNHLIDQYEKIRGIFNDIKQISDKIKENFLPIERKSFGITFFSSIDLQLKDKNRQDPSFMYSQLLKDLILNYLHYTETDQQTKFEMLKYLREIYSTDKNTLNILDEFEKNYLPELSIYWYTRECFLYKIINRALWTSQPDILYKLRYFLRHLHQQIVTQSLLQKQYEKPIIVYRGQNIFKDEMNKIKENCGGFLSFNNFLSTSLDRHTAISFTIGNEISVLFEMYVHPDIKKYPFASIEHLSYQQGKQNEKEILFSMGTLFRIVSFDQEKYFYRVQLMLTNDIDQKLQIYTQQTQQNIRSTSCFLSFIKLIYELKQFHSLDYFAQIFNDEKQNLFDLEILDEIHNTFGLIYHDRGQLNDALRGPPPLSSPKNCQFFLLS